MPQIKTKKRANRIFLGDHHVYMDVAYNPKTKVLRFEGGAQRGAINTKQALFSLDDFFRKLDIPLEELKSAINRVESGETIFAQSQDAEEEKLFCDKIAEDGEPCCLDYNHVGPCQSIRMVNMKSIPPVSSGPGGAV
jgi:hypothetical protein